MKKHYQVSELPKIPGLREMRREDVSQVRELLSSYLERFDVAQMFSKDEEVEHWFLSGQGREENGKRVEQVVWAYVVEVSLPDSDHLRLPIPFVSSRSDRTFTLYSYTLGQLNEANYQDPTTHLITDFMSFYSLPSSIMQSPKHDTLNAAYLFYYASDAIFSPGGSSDDAEKHEAKAKSKLAERLNALSQDMLSVAQGVSILFFCPSFHLS
jgi:glycylpeptide N-tetradecanoyltransferase